MRPLARRCWPHNHEEAVTADVSGEVVPNGVGIIVHDLFADLVGGVITADPALLANTTLGNKMHRSMYPS
jgi:hypothetical protein